ncbi:MAG TPA: UbiH/UbiF family hydroxylase [Beijerinckiaceae bacterium]|jgi:2-octaprenyl-6-methoxyphenol hydroxylase
MSGTDFDVTVVGAGAVGIAAALAFHRDGRRTALVGRPEARDDGRTVALLDGSVRLLAALDAWDAVGPEAAPLAIMRLIDDTGSLFRPPPVDFHAEEIGLPCFGWNIPAAALARSLAAEADRQGLPMIEGSATGLVSGSDATAIALTNGRSITSRLVVAADGRESTLREAAGIAARRWSYPQTALTGAFTHDRDHRDVSTEFHTKEGPFTLVPLPGRRSSLVWMMRDHRAEAVAALDDADFARAVEHQAQSMLGRMRLDGPRGRIPMNGLAVDAYAAPRLALVGEAAHVFPPIGAQGLNLGFRDVAALRDAVFDHGRGDGDPGGEAVLDGYGRGRARDVRLRAGAVDALNRSLLADLLPVDFARGFGLLALGTFGPLRRAVMREGILPRRAAPRLMRQPETEPARITGSRDHGVLS